MLRFLRFACYPLFFFLLFIAIRTMLTTNVSIQAIKKTCLATTIYVGNKVATKIEVGPSAPPITPIDEATRIFGRRENHDNTADISDGSACKNVSVPLIIAVIFSFFIRNTPNQKL